MVVVGIDPMPCEYKTDLVADSSDYKKKKKKPQLLTNMLKDKLPVAPKQTAVMKQEKELQSFLENREAIKVWK